MPSAIQSAFHKLIATGIFASIAAGAPQLWLDATHARAEQARWLVEQTEAAYRAGEFGRAAGFAREAYALEPTFTTPNVWLLRIHRETGNARGAATAADRLGGVAVSAPVEQDRAWAYLQSGQPERALVCAERAHSIDASVTSARAIRKAKEAIVTKKRRRGARRH